VAALEDEYALSGAAEVSRGDQAVVAAADYDGVVFHGALCVVRRA